jgi:hypothetical protein
MSAGGGLSELVLSAGPSAALPVPAVMTAKASL